jgi:beta-lactamase regulating signal transducer with metallopeptidase domain
MQKQTKSLLQELEELGNNRDTSHIIESRASNIITSAINLIELISRHYPQDQAELLERKLLSAIKSKDRERFAKSLRKNTNEGQ